MNKRQRKKARKGEFSEFGFHIHVVFVKDSFEDNNALFDWYDDFTHHLFGFGVMSGGGISTDKMDLFLSKHGVGTSVTQEDVARVEEFLVESPEVLRFGISDPMDCNHFTDEEFDSCEAKSKERSGEYSGTC